MGAWRSGSLTRFCRLEDGVSDRPAGEENWT